ncbi:MAG: hypothetical protein AAGJ97_07465, partial [Planctomycetota bacterium]
MLRVLDAAEVLGLTAPWIPEVRALALARLNAAAEDIADALIDRDTLDAASVPELLDAARALASAGRPDAAARTLEAAAGLIPELPLTYQAALQVAGNCDDTERSRIVAWAAPGLLRTLHDRRATPIRDRTRRVAAREAERLRSEGRAAAAAALDARVAAAATVDLTIEVSWLGGADLDLRITEPGGTVCGPETRRTAGGGNHAGDGFGRSDRDTWERYVAPRAASGVYLVTIDRVWGAVTGKRVSLRVVRHGGTADELVSERPIELTGPKTEVFLTLTGGRRGRGEAADLTTVPDREQAPLDLSPTPEGIAAADRFYQSIGGAMPQVAGGAAAVGPGVAAFAPGVEIISEGIQSGVGAVVSADRRYVRLSVSPSFSNVV